MLLTCKKISDLRDLASLCNRGLPNIEGDQVAQQASSFGVIATKPMGTLHVHNCINTTRGLTFIHRNNGSNNFNFLNTLPNEFLTWLACFRFHSAVNLAVGMWLCALWLCSLGFNVPYLTSDSFTLVSPRAIWRSLSILHTVEVPKALYFVKTTMICKKKSCLEPSKPPWTTLKPPWTTLKPWWNHLETTLQAHSFKW